MKIEICEKCNGSGEISIDVGTHQSEYEYHTCNACDGTGKVITGIYFYSVPFTTDKQLIYDTDAKIVNIIREFESKTHSR